MFLIKKIVTTNQNMDNNNNNNNYFDEIEFDPLAELNNYYNKFINLICTKLTKKIIITNFDLCIKLTKKT